MIIIGGGNNFVRRLAAMLRFGWTLNSIYLVAIERASLAARRIYYQF